MSELGKKKPVGSQLVKHISVFTRFWCSVNLQEITTTAYIGERESLDVANNDIMSHLLSSCVIFTLAYGSHTSHSDQPAHLCFIKYTFSDKYTCRYFIDNFYDLNLVINHSL